MRLRDSLLRLILSVMLIAITVAVVLAIAGCSSTSGTSSVTVTTGTTTTTESLSVACPPGDSYMGCASGAPSTFTLKPHSFGASPSSMPHTVEFPDVSNYQGCNIDWRDVGAPGAGVKLGESDDIVDPCAAHNITGLKAAHKKVIVYWFVRPVSLTAEERAIVAALKSHGLTIAKVVIYSGPGTWPGGSAAGLATWEAAYTSIRPAMPYTGPVVAWQFTDDGHIAGLGYGDVSVDYGLLAGSPHLLVLDEEVPGIAGYAGPLARYVLANDPAPKPRPHAVTCAPYPKQKTAAVCRAVRAHGSKLTADIDHQREILRAQHCYAHRTRGKCVAELAYGDRLHRQLDALLK